MSADCYAQDAENGIQGTMRALTFNAEGGYISGLSLNRMGLLQHRHIHTGVFEEDVIALLQRYKHGNESTGHNVHINDLWQLSTNLYDFLRATIPICHERFPLLMCMPPLDIIGPPLLQTLRLVQELIATALHGRAALKQTLLQMTRTWIKLSDGQWPLL